MEEKFTIREATLRIETFTQDNRGKPLKGLSLAVEYAESDIYGDGEKHQISQHRITEAVFDALVGKLRQSLKIDGILVKGDSL